MGFRGIDGTVEMDWNLLGDDDQIQDQVDQYLGRIVHVFLIKHRRIYYNLFITQLNKSIKLPGSVSTSFAEAISINLFSAFFLASPWKLSGCHCWAAFLQINNIFINILYIYFY
jgi:hypothetical protein